MNVSQRPKPFKKGERICIDCRRIIAVDADGFFVRHSDRWQLCPGSGRVPSPTGGHARR